jgi:hypothetical protein
MIKVGLFVAFLSSLVFSAHSSRGAARSVVESRFAPMQANCPCTSTPVENAESDGTCAKVTLELGASSGGRCQPLGTGCNPNATATPCSFAFYVLIEAKTPPVPNCCETAAFTFTSRSCLLNGACASTGACDLGLPIPVTLPFEQDISGYGVNCGLAVGFKITELCGGALKTLVDADLKCCKC